MFLKEGCSEFYSVLVPLPTEQLQSRFAAQMDVQRVSGVSTARLGCIIDLCSQVWEPRPQTAFCLGFQVSRVSLASCWCPFLLRDCCGFVWSGHWKM